MKRILCAVLYMAMLVLSLAACGAQSPVDAPAPAPVASDSQLPVVSDTEPAVKTVVRLAGMTGPTGMGLARLLEDDAEGVSANDYEFTLAGSSDVLVPMVIKGELDIAAVPANLASVLYSKTSGGVRVIAVNTLGVLYIVNTDGTVGSLSDLVGKTVRATGQGAAPEYALRYVLTQNGIDPDADLTIEWSAEPAEVVSLMAAGEVSIAMLPQPYVTVAQSKVEGVNAVIDITEEWNAAGGDGVCLTGVAIASAAFCDEHPEVVAAFLEEYSASIDYANASVADAAQLIGKYEIVAAAVAEKALPFCNLHFLGGGEMKAAVEGYLGVLYAQNPAAVGGVMPGEDFYFVG